MQIAVETISNLERRLKISIPAETIDNKTLEKLKSIKDKIKLDGFRPGKIPFNIIQQRFGIQTRQEIAADLIQESYFQALKEQNLKPAGWPQIDTGDSKLDKLGEALDFTATLELFPEINLVLPNGETVTKLVAEVTEEDVEKALQKLHKQQATWREVSREAKHGDQLTIDFAGKIKDEAFPGGTAKDFTFELGEEKMLPDFENELIGAKPGTEVEFKIKFPKDYSDENLAGKKADFKVQVHKVSESHLPEMDAALLMKFGIDEGGIDTLRIKIRESMEKQLKSALEKQLQEELFDKLIELNPIEVPKVMIKQETEQLQKNAQELFARHIRKDVKDVPMPAADGFVKNAERRVRLGLLLAEIAKQENLTPNPDIVRKKVEKMTSSFGDKAQEIVDFYFQEQNKELLKEFENLALEEQTTDFLQKTFTIVEKKVSYNEAIS